MKRIYLAFALIFCLLTNLGAIENSVTGLMFAFPAEGELLKHKMELKDSLKIANRTFYSGQLEGRKVILVESGVGLVAAAMTAQLLIDQFKPEQILFSGICGAIDPGYRIGDLAVPIKWIIHDYGYYDSSGFHLAQKEDKRFIYFIADPNLLSAAAIVAKSKSLKLKLIDSRVPQIRISKIGSSGNSFVDQKEKRGWLRNQAAAEIVDMESAAVVQVANANNVPVLVIRSCSDLAGGSGSSTAEKELEQFFKVVADNSAGFLLEVLKNIK